MQGGQLLLHGNQSPSDVGIPCWRAQVGGAFRHTRPPCGMWVWASAAESPATRVLWERRRGGPLLGPMHCISLYAQYNQQMLSALAHDAGAC
jgi:hypothetical protein